MKTEVLDLGKQPIANKFLTTPDEYEFFYNLKVGFDDETKLLTHMEYVDPPLMFNENYAYRGSMSSTMVNHFKNLSDTLKQSLGKNIKILEIGSNDGVFLKNWKRENIVGIEPCKNFADELTNQHYKVYNRFWDTTLADEVLEKHGVFNLVYAANCICHIPDLNETFKGVYKILDNDGIFIFEDPSLSEMLNNTSYDQIYDEHPHIFSVTALNNILSRNNLKIINVEKLDVHGGSNRVWVVKSKDRTIPNPSVQNALEFERVIGLDKVSTFYKFSEDVNRSKQDLIQLLGRIKDSGRSIFSYGATSKSTTVFNYCKIDSSVISFITDTTPEKKNKFSPGMHIPIISPEEGFSRYPDFGYLGAWNFAKEIVEKEKGFISRGGRFFTHVPKVRFV